MRRFLLVILLLILVPTAEARAQGYQPAYAKVAEANGITVFVYRDDVLHCIVFRRSNTGVMPTCFDARPGDPSGPVQFWWVAKAGNEQVHVYHYLDGVAKCVLFQEDSNGMVPICIDRRQPS